MRSAGYVARSVMLRAALETEHSLTGLSSLSVDEQLGIGWKASAILPLSGSVREVLAQARERGLVPGTPARLHLLSSVADRSLAPARTWPSVIESVQSEPDGVCLLLQDPTRTRRRGPDPCPLGDPRRSIAPSHERFFSRGAARSRSL